MPAKYEKLPMKDPDETAVDFSSYYTYDSGSTADKDGRFTYGMKSEDMHSKYKSTFTYDGWDPNKMPEVKPTDLFEPSCLSKCFSSFTTVCCYLLWCLCLPITYWFTVKKTEKYERIIIFRLGNLLAAKGPGRVVVLPCIDKWTKVDMRMRAFSVPPQMIMLSDGAAIEVGADVYYRVQEPTKSLACVQDLNYSTRALCGTALHKHLTLHELKDIQNSKHIIAQTLQQDINKLTLTWGVEIGKIEFSQVKILQEQNPLLEQANNPLSVLSKVLFGGGGGGPGSGIMSAGAPTGRADMSNVNGADILSDLLGGATPKLVPPMPAVETAQLVDVVPAHHDPSTTPDTTFDGQYILEAERLVEIVEPHLSRDLVCDIQTVFLFVFTDGGTFYLDLLHDNGSVGVGEPPGGLGDVSVTLTLNKNVMHNIFLGRRSAFDCYMDGSLQVDGPLSSAKLLKLVIDKINESISTP